MCRALWARRGRRGVSESVGAAVVLAVFGLLCSWEASWGLSPKEILTHADRARGNLDGVVWRLAIEAQEENQQERRNLEIQARGYDFLAVMTDPPKVRGHKLLMVNHNMWFAKPGLSKPVPISPRQKLVGGASYGDIAATNYAEDYEVLSTAEEVWGAEKCYVFDLKALHKRVTYDRIKYWVSAERLVGVRAEYYTLSEKKFKEAEFEYAHKVGGSQGQDGQPFISSMKIVEALAGQNVTFLRFGKPRLQKVPDSTFNVNLLMTR